MMHLKYYGLVVFVVLGMFGMNGCGAVAALVVNPGTDKMLDYNTSAENQKVLRHYSDKGYRIKLGKFIDASESNNSVKCRLMTSVVPPKDETYAAYIEHAFQKELSAAKLYDPHSRVTISAVINEIEGSTMYGDAYWSSDITYVSSNGKQLHIKSTYQYESSISAAYACSDMYKTFPLALNRWIHDAITHPEFETLLRKK